MTDRIKTAFDNIRAEESLKVQTTQFLHAKISARAMPRGMISVKRVAVVFTLLFMLAVGGFSSYHLYFTESAYVDLDVNPSLALAVNRFDRVIGAYAYNADGADVLAGIDILHQNYRNAVETAISAMEQKGFIANDAFIAITLQTSDEQRASDMLTRLESSVQSHHGAARIHAFSVNRDTRSTAHELNLSPAKYLAILDLQAVDPSATIDSCRGHSIGEIYALTEARSGAHHNGAASAIPEEDTGSGAGHDQSDSPQITPNDEPRQSAGHAASPDDRSGAHHGKGGGHGRKNGHN